MSRATNKDNLTTNVILGNRPTLTLVVVVTQHVAEGSPLKHKISITNNQM
ncbi:hypothetical protein J1N35_034126 [Gossypium stocksii]|uniref:Uncharacterized protein n=1 Tax=Gossypium stocksii TaxID=47602 RepID=A0A9D3ZNZ8_9ROSI|nr:hypothetical protein J1N35_034126 [Gossypium stocksii]